MVAVSDLQQLYGLLDPGLWWLWEMVGIIFYFTWQSGKKWGKNWHIILRWTTDHWHMIGSAYVSPKAKHFKWGRGLSFFSGEDAGAFTLSTLFGGNATATFHDVDKARPRESAIAGLPNGLDTSKPTTLKLVVNNRPVGPGKDPTSQDFDDFAERESMWQVLRSNALGHPDVMVIILAAGVAGMAGLLIGPYVFPHNVPVPVYVNGTLPK